MAIVNSYASHYQRVYDDIASTRIRHQKAKDKLKKKTKTTLQNCPHQVAQLVPQNWFSRSVVWPKRPGFEEMSLLAASRNQKKRKGHVTNTLHQRVGVKRSWVPSSNQTWLAGKATIYSWYKNPPLSGDDSEKLPISGSQMEKQFLRWRRLQILGSFPMFIHTYYNDTYIYIYVYIYIYM